MTKANTLRRRGRSRCVTVLLLLAFTVTTLSPIVQLAFASMRNVCQCCKRAGVKSCCRKHRSEASQGVVFETGTSCPEGCSLSISVAPLQAGLTIQTFTLSRLPRLSPHVARLVATPTANSSYVSLRQRPPPSCSLFQA